MAPGPTNTRARVHKPPLRGVALAMHEPIGVAGVVCPDEAPLLGFVSLVAPLIAMGNRVVVVPSERHPLAATDFYSGARDLGCAGRRRQYRHRRRRTWPRRWPSMTMSMRCGSSARKNASAIAEKLSAGNLKRTLVDHGLADRLVRSALQPKAPILLRHAAQVKNIWIPYGE